MVASICSRCQKRLSADSIRVAGKQFHPNCYRCDHCQKPLVQQVVPKVDRLYHPECYDRLFVPRCAHCGESIQGQYQRDGQKRYHPNCYTDLYQLRCDLCAQDLHGRYLLDAWNQKAHLEHEGNQTGQCHVCSRLLLPQQSRCLEDGRLLCAVCEHTEVTSYQDILVCKQKVLAYMHAVGFAYIPDYIKVEFATDQALTNQRLKASPTANIHGYTRTQQRNIPGYGLILEHSITIMSGLPALAFSGVLAHELLHVWIHEQNLHHLSHADVEGFCNLGSALIYHQDNGPLAQVLLARMDADPDPAYGEGYRAMAWRLQKLGWSALLTQLQTHEPLLAVPVDQIEARATNPAVSPTSASSSLSATEQAQARLRALKTQIQERCESNPVTLKSVSGSDLSEEQQRVADKVRARFAQKPTPPSSGKKLKKLR